MRKTKVFAAVTTAALATAGISVFATQPETKTDAYLIIDLEKFVQEEETAEEASSEADTEEILTEAAQPEVYLDTYLDLSDLDNTGSYTVNGSFG